MTIYLFKINYNTLKIFINQNIYSGHWHIRTTVQMTDESRFWKMRRFFPEPTLGLPFYSINTIELSSKEISLSKIRKIRKKMIIHLDQIKTVPILPKDYHLFPNLKKDFFETQFDGINAVCTKARKWVREKTFHFSETGFTGHLKYGKDVSMSRVNILTQKNL